VYFVKGFLLFILEQGLDVVQARILAQVGLSLFSKGAAVTPPLSA